VSQGSGALPDRCGACGSLLPEEAVRFCTVCGARVNATVRVDSRPRPLSTPVVFLLGVVATATVATIVVMWYQGRDSTDGDGGPAPVTIGQPTPAVPSHDVVTEAPSWDLSPRQADPVPTTPAEALTLSTTQAATGLDWLVDRDRPAVADLADSWVPQVSSKCAGLTVDLGPGYQPDGIVDTTGVTEPQILALHVALSQRYGAVTTTPEILGIKRSPSVCKGQPLWISLVPQRQPSAQRALQWCADAGFPVQECAARWVVPPGATGTRVVNRPGA